MQDLRQPNWIGLPLTEGRRLERLLQIDSWLRNRQRPTTVSLTEALELSERTVRSDSRVSVRSLSYTARINLVVCVLRTKVHTQIAIPVDAFKH